MSILYFRNSDGKFIQIPSIPGKSAYEIAVEYGLFEGTEKEFAQQQIFENKEILDSITQEKIDSWDKGGNIDLSPYATKEYVDDAIDEIDVTEQLKDYAKTEDVPTKVSQLENDEGYLTEHQDISHLATKEELHKHDNKEILDMITQSLMDLWSQKLVIQYDEETMDLFIGLTEPDTIAYVEYIENISESYIDTGLYANYNWKYEIVVEDNVCNQYENYFGTNSTNVRLLRGNNEGVLLFGYGSESTHNYAITGKKVTICVDRNKLYIDNELIVTRPENTSTALFDRTLLLFQARYQNALDKYGVFKCYSFKAWNENDVLVLDFRPCLDTQGIPCMYDEISKRYFYNVGTGTFAYGSRINVGGIVKEGLIANLCEFDVAGRKMIDTVGNYDLTVTGSETMVNTDNLFVGNASAQQGTIILPMVALTKFTFSYVVVGNWDTKRKQIINGSHQSTFYMWFLSGDMNIYYSGTNIIRDGEYTTLAEDNARFIDVTLDVTNGHCCFYVNGELKIEKTGLSLNQATSNDLYLNHAMGTDSKGNFILYSFKVYDRCLNQEEIQKNIEYETKRLNW